MKMFDNLIGNPDRNMGNLIVDDDWNLFLIDHSRAFVVTKDLPVKMEHIDRERLEPDARTGRSHADGRARNSGWTAAASAPIVARRDRMKAAIDILIEKSSEAAVFAR